MVAASRLRCTATFRGHRNGARRRRPAWEATLRAAASQVRCVAALSEERAISGCFDKTLKVRSLADGRCLET